RDLVRSVDVEVACGVRSHAHIIERERAVIAKLRRRAQHSRRADRSRRRENPAGRPGATQSGPQAGWDGFRGTAPARTWHTNGPCNRPWRRVALPGPRFPPECAEALV